MSNVAAQVALNDDVRLIDVITDLSLFFRVRSLTRVSGVDASCFRILLAVV